MTLVLVPQRSFRSHHVACLLRQDGGAGRAATLEYAAAVGRPSDTPMLSPSPAHTGLWRFGGEYGDTRCVHGYMETWQRGVGDGAMAGLPTGWKNEDWREKNATIPDGGTVERADEAALDEMLRVLQAPGGTNGEGCREARLLLLGMEHDEIGPPPLPYCCPYPCPYCTPWSRRTTGCGRRDPARPPRRPSSSRVRPDGLGTLGDSTPVGRILVIDGTL